MKAYVMVDMQKDFIEGVLGNESTRNVVKNVVEKLKNIKGDFYYTMDTHSGDYMNTEEGRNLPVPHCIEGTEGYELTNAIAAALPENAVMVQKVTFGAKNLPAAMNIEDIEEIELFGVCTDICVISNAMLLKAFFPNKKITVDASCCAGTSKESHERALEAMKMCHINIK